MRHWKWLSSILFLSFFLACCPNESPFPFVEGGKSNSDPGQETKEAKDIFLQTKGVGGDAPTDQSDLDKDEAAGAPKEQTPSFSDTQEMEEKVLLAASSLRPPVFTAPGDNRADNKGAVGESQSISVPPNDSSLEEALLAKPPPEDMPGSFHFLGYDKTHALEKLNKKFAILVRCKVFQETQGDIYAAPASPFYEAIYGVELIPGKQTYVEEIRAVSKKTDEWLCLHSGIRKSWCRVLEEIEGGNTTSSPIRASLANGG